MYLMVHYLQALSEYDYSNDDYISQPRMLELVEVTTGTRIFQLSDFVTFILKYFTILE